MSIKTVEVTKNDIKRCNILTEVTTANCPVARAINRAFKKKVAVVNGDGNIFIKGPDLFFKNEKITDFINKFDSGDDVEPFSFKLEINRIGNCHEGNIYENN